jgi:hypothetical protein
MGAMDEIELETDADADVDEGYELCQEDVSATVVRNQKPNQIEIISHDCSPKVRYPVQKDLSSDPRLNPLHTSRRSDCQLLRIEGATWSALRILTAVFSVF